MSDNQILPDDPRLTAYALDELDPSEREAFEALIAGSPTAQAALREIRDVAVLLASELRQESAPTLTAAQRATILQASVPTAAKNGQTTARHATWWVSRFAALVTMAALVALAVFLPAPGKRSDDLTRSTVELSDESLPNQNWELALSQRQTIDEGELASQMIDGVVAGNQTDGLSSGFENRPLGVIAGKPMPAEGKPDNRFMGFKAGDVVDGTSRLPAGVPMTEGSVRLSNKLAKEYEAGDQVNLARGGKMQDGEIRRMQAANRPESKGDPGLVAHQPTSAPTPLSSVQPQKGLKPLGPVAARGKPAANESAPVPALATTNETRQPLVQHRYYVAGAGLGGAQPASGAGGGSGLAKGFPPQSQPLGLSYARQATGRERGADPQGRYADGGSKSLEDLQQDSYWFDAGAPGTEVYDAIVENPFLSAYEAPLSTFGVDVDTASYSNVRRFLTDGQRPPPNAVRIEELVNYFTYNYPQPAAEQPFSVNVEASGCPWNTAHRLVRIGLKGREIARDKRPAGNLVFLVDVSGSMQAENKLPLVKMGLNLLTQQMTESDKVAIVTYADTAALRLEATNGTNKPAIVAVIDSLQAGGSTNGAEGIQLAYRKALDHFIEGGTNRVILCTDGDFNVGVTGDDELVQLIQERARTKIFFSVFGFGMGNLKDGKLEKLADKGNGQYAYIDNQREAHKMFVDELAGTLVTIAKDVKIQVEFNPNQVGAHRLIGYENRVMAAQDFNNDAKDAGDIGAGHTVTALYEIAPAGEPAKPELGDSLRYRKTVAPQDGPLAHELLTVKLRYKLPEADASTLVEVPITDPEGASDTLRVKVVRARSRPSPDFNWAAAVAAFGMILRDSQFRGQASFDMVLELAQGAKGEDKAGRRQEFIDLVKRAKTLFGESKTLGGKGEPVPPGSGEPLVALPAAEAEAKASVNGRYKNLLRIVPAETDNSTYNAFSDYGRWDGTSYAGQTNLPLGYWVYVYPNWYIWGDVANPTEKPQ